MEGMIIPVLLHTLQVSNKILYVEVSQLLAVGFLDGEFRCSELLQMYYILAEI